MTKASSIMSARFWNKNPNEHNFNCREHNWSGAQKHNRQFKSIIGLSLMLSTPNLTALIECLTVLLEYIDLHFVCRFSSTQVISEVG